MSRLGDLSPRVWIAGLLLGCIGLAIWFPLPPNLLRPLDIRAFTPSLEFGLLFAALLLFLYGAYVRLGQLLRQGVWRPTLRELVLLSGMMGTVLLFVYPFNANDIYGYVLRGRLSSQFNLNPYLTAPDGVLDEALVSLNGEWRSTTTPYGPLWELTAAGITALAGERMLLALVLVKGVMLLAHIGSGLCLAALFSGERRRLEAAWTWLGNPALLLIFVVDGHNDGLMLLGVALAWLLSANGRSPLWHAAALVALSASILVKPITLLVAPFFFLASWRRLVERKARLQLVLGGGLGSLLLTGLAFLPFGSPLPLLQRLLEEGGDFAAFSPLAWLALLRGAWELDLSFDQLQLAAQLLFLGLALGLLWRTWNGRSPLRGSADLLFGYVWQALNFRLWYTSWPFFFLVADTHSDRWAGFRLRAGHWYLLCGQLSVVIYGHGWFYLFERNHLVSHSIGVPFTLLLPLLLAALPWTRGAVSHQTHITPGGNQA